MKRGTLDLTAADRDAVMGLLLGKATRVSAFFPDAEQRDQVLRRVRVIHNKDVGEKAGSLAAVRAGFASARHIASCRCGAR